jgi:hypothetical protein
VRWLGVWMLCSLLPLTLPACASNVSTTWEYESKGDAYFRVRRCVATTLSVPSKLPCVTSEEEKRP